MDDNAPPPKSTTSSSHAVRSDINGTPASLMLYASQIAAIIGYNRHKKISDALELVWERVAPESFRAALARTGVQTDTDRIDRLVREREDVRHLVATSLLQCPTSTDVAVQYEAAARRIEHLQEIQQADRQLVDATVKRNLFTTYGTAAESVALAKVRDTLGIHAHPDPVFYKGHVSTVRGVNVWIGGKIDAITGDRHIVLELKNRIRRLFYKVPFYEIIQLQCYLHLLDVDRGALVECLTTTTAPGGTAMNVVPVRRDKDLWRRTIVPKVTAFATVLLDLLGDTAFQDAFLTSSLRSSLVQTRINRAMAGL